MQRANDFLALRGNPILWLALHALLPYDSLLCLWLLHCYKKCSPHLEIWENEVTEFDSLCALARLASENNEARFFKDAGASSNELKFENLSHPLIERNKSVSNSLTLNKERRLVLLTGSNMAGKSTFLRAVGINQLLYNMGAPVFAKQFSCMPMRILCAIRIDDSLEEATSYFYAEVKRLRTILKELEEARSRHEPALFLVDEIFKGTNNKERFYGSWHTIHALLASEGFGLVSTHDLALAEIESKEAGVRNMHFRDHIEGSQFVFDYKLQEGPCPTTNALRIMRLEGLPIPDEAHA